MTTTQTISRERIEEIANFESDLVNKSFIYEDARSMARMLLAAYEQEPVAYNQVQRDIMKDIIVRKLGGSLRGDKLVMDDIHAVTMALIQAGFRTAPPSSTAMDSEPVAFRDRKEIGGVSFAKGFDYGNLPDGAPLYAAPPAPGSTGATDFMPPPPVPTAIPVQATVNDVTNGKPLTITLPDTSSKAFWSGSGKSEVFHPETYKRWAKEAIERDCCIARIEVKVK